MLATGMKTDVGMRRRRNEDSVGVFRHLQSGMVLAAVADGLGGHVAGKVASMAVLTRLYAEVMQWVVDGSCDDAQWRTWETKLRTFLVSLSNELYKRACTTRAVRGMGTTLTMAWANPERVCFAHSGDSRAYMLRGGILRPLTDDHTDAYKWVRSGFSSRRTLRFRNEGHLLNYCLCAMKNPVVDTWTLPWNAGDRLLLCSDGLTTMLYEDQIEDILRDVRDPQQCAEWLVELSNRVGGIDNTSVAIIDNVPVSSERD